MVSPIVYSATAESVRAGIVSRAPRAPECPPPVSPNTDATRMLPAG